MKEHIEVRVIKVANFILQTKYTIREVAKDFKYSKSSVLKDLKERLPELDKELSEKVKLLMQDHIDHRYITGGNSTRLKYLNKRTEAGVWKIKK
jgi:putative DeoR family transcriptional regulator (stage III sporulation protein D)